MLIRSKDRKVANAVTPSANVAIANTFGLPNGPERSCPFATGYCNKICYAGRIEKQYKAVDANLTANYNALRNTDWQGKVDLISKMIADFHAECEKRNAPKYFRIHWDGDFFDLEYTDAWSWVIRLYDDIHFWVYTRNPEAARHLHFMNIDNLSLYFSSDPDNIETARELKAIGILIAHVSDTFDEGKAEFPKATRCPENNKAIALVTPEGSACIRCGLCVNGRKDVLFSRTKR